MFWSKRHFLSLPGFLLVKHCGHMTLPSKSHLYFYPGPFLTPLSSFRTVSHFSGKVVNKDTGNWFWQTYFGYHTWSVESKIPLLFTFLSSMHITEESKNYSTVTHKMSYWQIHLLVFSIQSSPTYLPNMGFVRSHVSPKKWLKVTQIQK